MLVPLRNFALIVPAQELLVSTLKFYIVAPTQELLQNFIFNVPHRMYLGTALVVFLIGTSLVGKPS